MFLYNLHEVLGLLLKKIFEYILSPLKRAERA